jgi:hypothetical protein
VAFVIACIVLLGYVRPASCASFVVAWLGPLPTTVCRLLQALCSCVGTRHAESVQPVCTSDCTILQPVLRMIVLQVVLTIEAICSALAFMPTNPADGTTPTLQVPVDAPRYGSAGQDDRHERKCSAVQ